MEMKSPFPGMDPYIEACGLWEGFHGVLVVNIAEAIAGMLPERYLVQPGERSYIVMVEPHGQGTHVFLPDVGIAKTGTRRKRKSKDESSIAVLSEPVNLATMVALIDEEHREAFIEIRESGAGQRLITTIEVLSPSNKRPATLGWDLYQRKRQGCLLGCVNLVEIDLVRAGQRMPMQDPWPASEYTYLVARSKSGLKCAVWPIQLSQSLPPLVVPLASPDPDLNLELQPLVDSIYRRFRYERRIDYSCRLSPSLSRKDAAWAAGLVRAARKQT
jgi:hypothetical protein